MNDNDLPLSDLPELNAIKQAALFAAFQELVATYGEEAVAEFAAGLPDKIRTGAFSMAVALKH